MRFSTEHIKMISEMFPDCPKSDFDRFIFNAERLELDPLLGQIQLISRRYRDKNDKWHINHQTLLGRDAYRILADRTGELDGSETVPQFNEDGRLVAAKATVWRRGKTHPFQETVYLAEYLAEGSPFWKGKPITMLSKVAEAQALRKAFPSLLTGTYAVEEFDAPIDRETGEIMEETTRVPSPPPPPPAPAAPPVKPANGKANYHKQIANLILKEGINGKEFLCFLADRGDLHPGSDGNLHLKDLPEKIAQEINEDFAGVMKGFAVWKGITEVDLNALQTQEQSQIEAANEGGGLEEKTSSIPFVPTQPMPEGMHKALEAQLGKAGIDREQFKLFLSSVAWLKPDGEGKLHLTELSSTHGGQILANWTRTVDGFEKWSALNRTEQEVI